MLLFVLGTILILFTVLFVIAEQVTAEEELIVTDADRVGFSFTEDSATLHYEWDTKMTTTVEPNECNSCMAACHSFECKESCYNFYCK